MLNQIEIIFDDMVEMLRKLKKISYEKNMNSLRDVHGHFFDEMVKYIEASEDKDTAVSEVVADFIEKVFSAFSNKGKVNGRTQADMTFFMIYYVFPAIILTDSEFAKELCDKLRDGWNTKFGVNINYTDYDTLYNSFRNKIFGLF